MAEQPEFEEIGELSAYAYQKRLQFKNCLEEALQILDAYQFPAEQRAELALIEIDNAKVLIKEWVEDRQKISDTE